MKKVISIALLASMLGMNFVPVFAMTNSNESTKTPKQFKSMIKKSKKQKSNDYKYAYVNTVWWNNFNDANLSGYIDKAIKNNYDLKMATFLFTRSSLVSPGF